MQRDIQAHRVPVQVGLQALLEVDNPFGPSRSDVIDSTLAEVKEMSAKRFNGDENEELPGDQQKNIEKIKTLVETAILPSLVKVRDDAETQLETLIAAIKVCNTNGSVALAGTADVAGTTNSSRGKHVECRGTELQCLTNKTETCEDLTQFMTSIISPATKPTTTSPEEWDTYLKTMGDYYCPKYQIFEKKNRTCSEATATHTSTKANCDRQQVDFEGAFCTWQQVLTSVCEQHSNCYGAAVEAFKKRDATVREQIKTWKVEYTGLKKITCYIDIWMSDKNVETVNKKKLSECNAHKVDTSPMDIKLFTIPDKMPCDTTPVANYPGTDPFPKVEYASLRSPASTVHACLKKPAPAAPTTPPKPTAPPCVDDNAGLAVWAAKWGVKSCTSMPNRVSACQNLKVKSFCPKTCKTCKESKCENEDAEAIKMAKRDRGMTIKSCAELLDFCFSSDSKTAFSVQTLCPVTCGKCGSKEIR
jgi:hypothetical protein